MEKYRKDCTIEMFAEDKENLQPQKYFKFKDIENVTDNWENCSLSKMIMCKKRYIDTREEKEAMRLQQKNELQDLFSLLYNLQFSSLYRAFQTVLVGNWKYQNGMP